MDLIRDFIIDRWPVDARPDATTRRFYDTTEDDGRDVMSSHEAKTQHMLPDSNGSGDLD